MGAGRLLIAQKWLFFMWKYLPNIYTKYISSSNAQCFLSYGSVCRISRIKTFRVKCFFSYEGICQTISRYALSFRGNRTINYHEAIGNQVKTKYVLTLQTWLSLHRGNDYCVWVSTFLHYIEIKGKTERAHTKGSEKALFGISPLCSPCICIRRRGRGGQRGADKVI